MKKSFFYVAALMLGLAFTATSCSNDDDNEVSAADIDYNSENATSWHNYMKNVGRLLQTDATNLQAAWTTGGYGDAFINHNGEFTTAKTCVQQIIEGCIDIAGEITSILSAMLITEHLMEPLPIILSQKLSKAAIQH